MLATRLAQESLSPSPHCWEREARDPNLAEAREPKFRKILLACTLLRDSRKIDIYRVDDLKEKGADIEEDIGGI